MSTPKYLDEFERIRYLNSGQFRVFFVQTVKRFPCLWNRNLPEHRSLTVLAHGWESVAKIIGNGLTARECQIKWRTIRNNYTAYLKRGYPGESYLDGNMQFIRPFTKCGKVRNVTEDYGNDGDEMVKESNSDYGQNRVVVVNDYEITTCMYYEEDVSNQKEAPGSCQHLRIDSSDGDALFLLSMLPEMEAMNEEQKQTFKNAALALTKQFMS